jgi:hypothetical protein
LINLHALAVAGAVAGALAAVATGAGAFDPPAIRTSDVDLFYRVFDASNGAPSAETLDRDYIDGGSDGVRQFVPSRIRSGDALAKTIAAHPDVYARARTCMAALPAVRARLSPAFHKLAVIDPNATFPPVTVLIGRNNSGGTTGKSGVLIGLEVVCSASWLQPNIEDRLVHLIMHEYGHVQQYPDGGEDAHPATVLSQSLVEGEAELIAELTTGEASEVHLQRWTKGHEREIGEAFLKDADKTDLSAWFYNGAGTPDKPGDLGYWVGYRIAKTYYQRAGDKRAAMRTLLALKDPKAILAQSGWRPGS